jgi:predicted dehydrogenase
MYKVGDMNSSTNSVNIARTPLKIGILGAARIAPSAIVAPAHATGHRLVAVASRDIKKAQVFADQHQVEGVYGNYQDLIDDPEINVIYNALHNGAHAPWNIRAMQAGKDVLSEKPSATNTAQASEVAQVAAKTGRVFMEGFHYYYHPVFQRVLTIIKSGEIGDVTKVESALLIPMPDANDLRLQFDLAGGSMMDVGCYALHSQRMISNLIAGDEPTVLSTEVNASKNDIDTKLNVELQYPNGVKGYAKGDFESPEFNAPLTVTGTKGSIQVPNFVVSGWDDRVIVTVNGATRTEHLGTLSTYTYQLMAFADAVDFGKSFTTNAQDAVKQMQLIDAAYLDAGLPVRPVFKI